LQKNFIHWLERLEIFPKQERKFAKEILSIISREKSIASNELLNLASKYDLKAYDAQQVIHALKYDGYINNSSDEKTYRFNSPILRIWWHRNVAN